MIETVIRSITVTDDCFERFINWLAFIFQRRERTGTAWLFHGTTGTGKGSLFHEILTPLFGEKYCSIIGTKNLKGAHNGYLHNSLILFIDELKIKGYKEDQIEILNTLNTWITEKRVAIHKKYCNEIIVPNYTNIIITANERVPLPIKPNDRRYNIAPKQEEALPSNFSQNYKKIHEELDQFAAYLQHYKIRSQEVRKPIVTLSKNDLIEASLTSTEVFFRALKEGDFDYFSEAIDHDETTLKDTKYLAYEKSIRRWAETLNTEEATRITNHELLAVFIHILDQRASLKTVSMLATRHGLKNTQFKLQGIKYRGITTHFKGSNPFGQTTQPNQKVIKLHER